MTTTPRTQRGFSFAILMAWQTAATEPAGHRADEDIAMQTYTIQRDTHPDLQFNGELLARVSSSGSTGSPGRWTELELYQTAGGSYVAVEIGRTIWDGEHDRFSAEVCSNHDEVMAYLGHGWLAKDLYAQAGIQTAVVVP